MPNDKSANNRANVLVNVDGGAGPTSEHFGFGRDPDTNKSTGPRWIQITATPNGVVTAPAGSLASGIVAGVAALYINTNGAMAWTAITYP